MKRTTLFSVAAGSAFATLAYAAQTPPVKNTEPGVLHVSASAVVLEQGPVVMAIERYYNGRATLTPPGIPALFGEGGAPVVADVATHAETQALRHSIRHPDIRIIMTVTEGRYRMVGRKSHGIATLADLKGKKIGVAVDTSAAYFLGRMLQSAGLDESQVQVVNVPIPEMAEALAKGTIDALAIWEPEISRAQSAVGADAVVFPGDAVYRSMFNLNTTEGELSDPAARARIVRFVRAVLDASAEAKLHPAEAQAAVVRQTRHTAEDVAAAWQTYTFPAALHPGLLDALVTEEVWVAKMENRRARGRAEQAKLIDDGVLREARALPPALPTPK
ncbi:MAG: ABC transporter substrate-binding protein [Rhodospirillaceae bacterium]